MAKTFRPEQLLGHWALVSFTEKQSGGDWFEALGPNAKGSINYSADGYMNALIGAVDRPRFKGEWSTIPLHDKAQCLDRMVAYGGRFSVTDDRVLHHVEICWIPNWEGRTLERLVSFPKDGQLLLRTPEIADGRARPLQEVLWERVL